MFLGVVLLCGGCAQPPAEDRLGSDAPETVAFTGAQVWNGERFEARALRVREGTFVGGRVRSRDRVVPLNDAWVLPAFCDAHSHTIQSSWELETTLATLRESGVAYVKILSSVPEYTDEIAARLAAPDGVEASFAGPPVTGPGGHPIALQHRLLGYGAYPEQTIETLNGFSHYAIADLATLERQWPALAARNTDFVKVMVLDAARHPDRVGKPEWFGRTGLAPELLEPLVTRAHAAGRRVSAHVDTVADFRLAVSAGVDEIAHLPGRRSAEVLTAADAELAARNEVVVVTTSQLAERLQASDPELFATVRDAQAESLRQLRAAGVLLALGTDDHGSVQDEFDYLDALDVFDRRELLQMLTERCVATTFPGRRAGRLEVGFEASFVVLDGNPLDDPAALRQIRLRVKQPGEPASR